MKNWLALATFGEGEVPHPAVVILLARLLRLPLLSLKWFVPVAAERLFPLSLVEPYVNPELIESSGRQGQKVHWTRDELAWPVEFWNLSLTVRFPPIS